MSKIYDEIGVKPIINASGSMTELGGSLMSAEVMKSMEEASRDYVHLPTLRSKVEAKFSEWLNVPAVHICSGASAGISLAAAAAITRSDQEKVKLVPANQDSKNLFLVPDAHRNRFDHAVHTAGGEIREFTNDINHLQELLDDERVVAVYYTLSWFCSGETVSLNDAAELAHQYGKAVIVDAAAQLPPLENFQEHLKTGADAVIFSGGKTINGPQTTGLVVGNAEFIAAVRENNFPNIETVGRPMKVSKEDIAGLYTAVKSYLARDHDRDQTVWNEQLDFVSNQLGNHSHLQIEKLYPAGPGYQVPYLKISWQGKPDCDEVLATLQRNETPIYVRQEWNAASDKSILIYAHTLKPGDEKKIAPALQAVFE